jgi:hypothetical protein
MTRQFLKQRLGRQVLIKGKKTNIYSQGGDRVLYTDVIVFDVSYDFCFAVCNQNYSHLYLPRYFKLEEDQVNYANVVEYKRNNGTIDYSVEAPRAASEILIGEIKLTLLIIIGVTTYSAGKNHTKIAKPLRKAIADRISYLLGEMSKPIHRYSLEALPIHYRKELLPFLNCILDCCLREPKNLTIAKKIKTNKGFAKI